MRNESTEAQDVPPRNAIQILVQYWEWNASEVGARLDELLHQGISQVVSWVPWQAYESDIQHRLHKFLQACALRGIRVKLVLTPELGVHYRNSGMPKDLVTEVNGAVSDSGSGYTAFLGPNAFLIPSLYSPDFTKRYYGYLVRFQSFLTDLERADPEAAEAVTIVMTGSFWKYYRSPVDTRFDIFGGTAGDWSKSAAASFRQAVDEAYSAAEYAIPQPSANRWKTRIFDEINRKWFFQRSEELFRKKFSSLLGRLRQPQMVEQMEVYTPEADPALTYSEYLRTVTGGQGDFFGLSRVLEAASYRVSAFEGAECPPYFHWTGLGAFRSLSDSEKQFLILKSLILAGARGGGVMIDETEWFSLSSGFRAKAENLARALSTGKLALSHQVSYLTAHLWSAGGSLWNALYGSVGPGATMVTSVDLLLKTLRSRLIVVDPSLVLNSEAILKLMALADSGRVVLLPKGSLYTDPAEQCLNEVRHARNALGLKARLLSESWKMGRGKILFYVVPQTGTTKDDVLAHWKELVSVVLAAAEIRGACQLSDSRLSAIPLSRREAETDEAGLFVLNGTGRSVHADLVFPIPVEVDDLSVSIAEAAPERDRSQAQASIRYSLEVPPCGILSLAVRGLDLEHVAQAAQRAAMEAAENELPGFGGN